MQGALQYLNATYPKSVLSEIFYLRSAVVAGVMTAQNNVASRDAIAILYHYIYWVPQDIGFANIDFNDQFGNLIFRTLNVLTLPNWAPIPMVQKGVQVRITCSVNTVQFSISYQYVMQPGDLKK